MTATSETIMIALNKLDRDPKNVRKTYRQEGIAELAANIREDGYRLLQNIVVRKGEKKGRFFVTAGERRRLALLLLAEQGEISKDFLVESKVREEADAIKLSLAENVMREDMHPVDQYEAYKEMVDAGTSIVDIAARFSVTETIVKRRLALARVSPVLLELYRQEEMTYEQLAAFTVSDDHERQLDVWNSLPEWGRYASTIKSALAGQTVSANDKRMKFIGGVEAYEAAGGAILRDLFSDQNTTFGTDIALLERLVAEKLETEAEAVRAEGWQWVECHYSQPNEVYQMKRHYPDDLALSDEDQAELDRLTLEHDELCDKIEAGDDVDEAEARYEVVAGCIEELQAKAKGYTPETIAACGAFVYLDYYGKLSIERGFVRQEQGSAVPGLGPSGDNDEEEETVQETGPAKPKLTHSVPLVEYLTAQKTAALRMELAHKPEVALVAVVHAMLLNVSYKGQGNSSALQIGVGHERIEGKFKVAGECGAAEQFADLVDQWADHLPGNPADLWEWCLAKSTSELMTLLAFAAAHSVNAVEERYSGHRKEAFAHANELGCALKVEMTEWFRPTAENYFGQINKQSIEAVVSEVKGETAACVIRKKSKSEAAMEGENAVRGTGWLPAPLRIVGMEEPETQALATLPEAAE